MVSGEKREPDLGFVELLRALEVGRDEDRRDAVVG